MVPLRSRRHHPLLSVFPNSNCRRIGKIFGLAVLLQVATGAEALDANCNANLTCARSVPAIIVPPASRGPDLSTWRLTALAPPSRGAGEGPLPPERLTDPTLGLELVLMPGACYQPSEGLGPAESALEDVCLGPYYLGVHEVTFEAYDRFARETQRDLPEDEGWGRGERPVINVNVYDALGFAKWLSRRSGARYRLPTETEWEHAARAGAITAYPWGETIGMGLANCDGCGSTWDGEQTAPVGSFPPNPWGLHDMIGNVGEWTCSMRDPDPARSYAQCDGIYETRRRVYRNGGWSDGPERLTAAFRDWNAAFRRTDDVGFRLLRECPECVAPAPVEPALAERSPGGGDFQGGMSP